MVDMEKMVEMVNVVEAEMGDVAELWHMASCDVDTWYVRQAILSGQQGRIWVTRGTTQRMSCGHDDIMPTSASKCTRKGKVLGTWFGHIEKKSLTPKSPGLS